MSPLDNLTALAREQLRYIVERVPEWPGNVEVLWVGRYGGIVATIRRSEWVLIPGEDLLFPRASRNFTRAQYDAMKAELDSTDICAACKRLHDAGTTCCPDCIRRLEAERDRVAAEHDSIDYRAHCEALAGALEDMLRIYGSDFDEECLRKDEVERAFLDLARAVLTRWKEEGK